MLKTHPIHGLVLCLKINQTGAALAVGSRLTTLPSRTVSLVLKSWLGRDTSVRSTVLLQR